MTKSKPLMKIASLAAGVLPAGFKRMLYKIPFLTSFIRRSLNAAAPDGFTQTTIAAGPAKGFCMSLDLHAEKDYWLGTYEPDLQAAARTLIEPGFTVYDIGANIGFISLLSSNLVGPDGRVFAFEALPSNIDRLTGNVHLNNLTERIRVIHSAVVEKPGDVTFLTHASGAMGKAVGSAGRDEHYQSRIVVPGVALDDFSFQQGNPLPDLIKMDIEGGEGSALKGASRILTEQKPLLLIELHGEEAARQAWDILTAHTYTIHEMKNSFPRITDIETLDWKAYITAIPAVKVSET